LVTGGQPKKREPDLPSAPTQSTKAPATIEPDIWLSDAMWRAFLRTDYIPEGGVQTLAIKEPEKQRFVMLIIDEFRQLAFDGKLPIGEEKTLLIWNRFRVSFGDAIKLITLRSQWRILRRRLRPALKDHGRNQIRRRIGVILRRAKP
jgi:hypothetical protein